MLKQALITGITVGLICLATIASAEAYKWTDPNGHTIYSQTPPPLGTPYELVNDDNTADTGLGDTHSGEIQDQVDAYQKAREEKLAQEKLIAESNQIKQQNCEQARTNLTALTSRGQVTIEEDGLYRKLTEEQRQSRIQLAQSHIDKYCS